MDTVEWLKRRQILRLMLLFGLIPLLGWIFIYSLTLAMKYFIYG